MAASNPVPGISSTPSSLKASIVAAAGATPCPQTTRRSVALAPQHDRHFATWSVEVRLDDLEDKTTGSGGIEGVATPLENTHGGAVASQWVLPTIPKLPVNSGRSLHQAR